MNDCTRTAALLDVYADDEAAPETNALVQEHLDRCERCARELRAILALRAQLRATLGAEGASEPLRSRLTASIAAGQPASLAGVLRFWWVPASAAIVVFAVWMGTGAPVDPLVQAAVEEHVICALNGRATRVGDAVAVERGYSAAMPWIRDLGESVRVLDAHTCGGERTFSHLILATAGARASILIAPRTAASVEAPPDPVRYGRYDVSEVASPKHSVYVIVPRGRAGDEPAWRAAALDRVARFLAQLEGSS